MSSAKKRRDTLKGMSAEQRHKIELGGAKSMATMWEAGAIKLGEENKIQAEELATLRAENTALTLERDMRRMAETRNAELLSENEVLKKDAERYRWLKQHPSNNRYPHISQYPSLKGENYPQIAIIGIDAAIDAELAKGKL